MSKKIKKLEKKIKKLSKQVKDHQHDLESVNQFLESVHKAHIVSAQILKRLKERIFDNDDEDNSEDDDIKLRRPTWLDVGKMVSNYILASIPEKQGVIAESVIEEINNYANAYYKNLKTDKEIVDSLPRIVNSFVNDWCEVKISLDNEGSNTTVYNVLTKSVNTSENKSNLLLIKAEHDNKDPLKINNIEFELVISDNKFGDENKRLGFYIELIFTDHGVETVGGIEKDIDYKQTDDSIKQNFATCLKVLLDTVRPWIGKDKKQIKVIYNKILNEITEVSNDE